MQKSILLLTILLFVYITVGCGTTEQGNIEREIFQGNANAGRQHLIDYGCGACHTIDSIPGANGVVGPPLGNYEMRHYIAGELPNKFENLVKWIQNPKSVNPDTAMPDLNLTRQEAMNIVAYFYSE